MKKNKVSSNLDSVLIQLEALLPDIREAVLSAGNFSRKNLKVSRKNKLYKESSKEPPMSSKDLAKRLREMAEAIEQISNGKPPETKENKPVEKPAMNKPKSEARLLALMEGKVKDQGQKIVMADLKIVSNKEIAYSDIKNIMINIFKFKPGDFSGVTRDPDDKRVYAFMVYENSLKKCLESTNILIQGQIRPWSGEYLSKHVALAATVCAKIVNNSTNLKAFKRVASSILKSLDGNLPCIVDEIIMSAKVQK